MNLITDRTRGAVYGVEDLNRVESAVAELLELVKPLDLQENIVVKTDWGLPGTFSASTWPTVGQMERYLGNVHRLCDLVEVAASLPATMDRLKWYGANQIEEALLAVESRIRSIINIFQYSGEFYAGEGIGL